MLRQGRAASRLWCSQDSGATESVPLQPLLSHVEASTCRVQHDSVQHQQQQKQVERRSMEACPPSDSLKPMTSSSKSSSNRLCQASGRHGSQHVWQIRAVSRIWTGVLLLSLACMAIWAPAAHAATNAGDKAALLAFKSNITSDSGLLQTWSASTDPCGVGSGTPWVGISCTCNGSLPGDYDLLCGEEPVPSTDNGTRVLALNFGDILISEGRKLTGRISPDLDQLTELRLLNLRQNQLSVRVQALQGSAKLMGRCPNCLEQGVQGEHASNMSIYSLPVKLASMAFLMQLGPRRTYRHSSSCPIGCAAADRQLVLVSFLRLATSQRSQRLST